MKKIALLTILGAIIIALISYKKSTTEIADVHEIAVGDRTLLFSRLNGDVNQDCIQYELTTTSVGGERIGTRTIEYCRTSTEACDADLTYISRAFLASECAVFVSTAPNSQPENSISSAQHLGLDVSEFERVSGQQCEADLVLWSDWIAVSGLCLFARPEVLQSVCNAQSRPLYLSNNDFQLTCEKWSE